MADQEDARKIANADEGGDLDPKAAPALLEQTQARAQRQFDMRPPLLTLTAAVVVLIAYGTIWLSVRGQHPYEGPTLTALAAMYLTVFLWILLVAVVRQRATSGVSGRSSRQRRAEGAAFAAIWLSVYVFGGALYTAGASHAIIYGIYPAAAPLIIVGSAAAAYSAARQNWRELGFAVAAVVIAAVGAYAGPADVWRVIGVGGCLLLLGYTAVRFWARHA